MLHRTIWSACLLSTVTILPLRAQVPDQVRPQVPDHSTTSSPKESTIASTGTARVERTPDYVDVMLGSVSIDKSAGAAHAAASKSMETAIAAIKALKLEGEDLQTGSVDLSPRYERRDHNEEVPRIIGYQASVTLRVRTGDLKSVPRIIDAALAAGCNRVDYIQFGIKEAIAAREEAVKLATQAAKRKAIVMAEALDLRITRVIEASTTSQQWGGWYGGNRISQMANVAGGQAGQGEGGDAVVPGKIEVWAEATVKFGADGSK
jgi:uncharacterized protein